MLTNAKQVKDALQAIRNAEVNLKAGSSGKALLDKALAFYGTDQDRNNVMINFNNNDPRSLGSTRTDNGVTTISFGRDSLTRMGPTGKAETVGHEGTHDVFELVVPGSIRILDRVEVALGSQLVRLLGEGPQSSAIAMKKSFILGEKAVEIGPCHVVLQLWSRQNFESLDSILNSLRAQIRTASLR
jgi:hypothetical protein